MLPPPFDYTTLIVIKYIFWLLTMHKHHIKHTLGGLLLGWFAPWMTDPEIAALWMAAPGMPAS